MQYQAKTPEEYLDYWRMTGEKREYLISGV